MTTLSADALRGSRTRTPTPERCPDCGTGLTPAALSCPSCQALIHRARLTELAARARDATPPEAIAAWREALGLLPPDSVQAKSIRDRIEKLEAAATTVPGGAAPAGDAPSGDASTNAVPKWLAGLGAVGVLLWKFKFVLVFLLTKAKVLLLGLTKWKTLLSMLVALGAYWALWGWWFALGFVLSVYVHEMGHVVALRHYGIAASPPMFIPGLGAFVAMKEYPQTPVQDARIGLAGPAFGLGATLLCLGVYLATDAPIFAALTRTGAFINLFNLLPIWQLDGGRAFESLGRRQRWWAVAAVAVALTLTGETLLWLLLLGGVYRAWATTAPPVDDPPGLYYFVGLVAVFSALSTLVVPGVP